MSIKYIDAKRLKKLLIAGSKWLVKHEDVLNDLNVYPVPDGDTGSNMSMTISAVEEELGKIDENKNMTEVVETIQEAILMGARGNSGTILSQIITGFLYGIGDKQKLYSKDVVEALKSAKDAAYNAVSDPVEGTILTVIRKVSESAEEYAKNSDNLIGLMEHIKNTAHEAVEQTPEELPKLKEAGVVDAGGKGLYYMLEGFYQLITDPNLVREMKVEEKKDFHEKINLSNLSAEEIQNMNNKYCTEFIIIKENFDEESFKNEILALGDSQVFAGTPKKYKVHVHTDNPGKALEIAVKYGELEKVKIDNMKLQQERHLLVPTQEESNNEAQIIVNDKESKFENGYLLIADTKELADKFLKYGADVVVLGGQSNNPSVKDIIKGIEKVNKNNVYVFPNNKNIISAAKLACGKTNKEALVIETKSMLEGMYFIQNKDEEINSIINYAKLNTSIEITRAVRNTKVNDLEIFEGNYIALVNGKIKYKADKMIDLIKEIEAKEIVPNTIGLTVVNGLIDDEEVNNSLKQTGKKYNYQNFSSNQEAYNYYIYIENRDPNLPEIAIVTDSTSDLAAEDIIDLPIKIVPLRLYRGNEELRDGIEISKSEFWEDLLSKKVEFKTSQPSPQDFLNTYNKLLKKGYKKIISIQLSAKLSGTIQAARVARNLTGQEDKITIIDSESVSLGLGYLVLESAKKALRKETHNSIVEWVENFKKKSRILIIVNDLSFLERGGRIGKARSLIGGALQVKPVLTLHNGEITEESKIMGEGRALKYIEKVVREETRKNSVNVLNVWGGTSKELELSDKIMTNLKKLEKVNYMTTRVIGSVIGSHSGPIFGLIMYPRLN